MARIEKQHLDRLFDQLSEDEQDVVVEIAGNFHYRTRMTHPDGSLGVIKITPGELRDALAYALKH